MIPTTRILSDEELHNIDCASRELLWDVGVTVHDEKALKIYQKAGAEVDFSKQIVRLHSHLISDALRKRAPSVQLYGRDGILPMNVGGMRSYFGTIGFASNALENIEGGLAYLTTGLTGFFLLLFVLYLAKSRFRRLVPSGESN